MKKRKNKKTALILVLVLLISVGYAALASNLKINGSSKVNAAKWNVYWDNIQITNGSVPADNDHKARITDSGKTQVEFSIELNEPGDYYEFTVDAVNNGTIDAMIAANGIVNGVYSDSNYTQTATLPDAVSYTVTYADGSEIQDKHLLAKKSGNTATRETYKVRIEYRNDDEIDADDLDENDQTYYFKFSVNYVQADNTAVDRNQSAITVIRQNEGQITLGDVVRIGDTENFYVISSDSTKTVLLAKYALAVGEFAGEYLNPATTQGYGLQNVNATQSVEVPDEEDSYYGTVAFSSTNYWHPNDNGLISPYNANGATYSGNPFPVIYNNTYTTTPNFSSTCQYDGNDLPLNNCWATSGYSIAYYVEQYKTKLIEIGAPNTITGRLLSYEEAEDLEGETDAENHLILSESIQFWLGSANGSDQAWGLFGDIFNPTEYYDYTNYGVRPVIEIPTSELN